jgi:multidrug efflux pump subunit AcrA (membrane-fusion protein)
LNARSEEDLDGRASARRAGGAVSNFASRREEGHDRVGGTDPARDLEAIVSASGKIEPRRTVNISAQSMGRVTRLAVNEGDR